MLKQNQKSIAIKVRNGLRTRCHFDKMQTNCFLCLGVSRENRK